MSYRRKNFARSSALRHQTVVVPLLKPGGNPATVHGVMGLEDGSTNNFKVTDTELMSTSKVAPGVGVLLTVGGVASDEDLTFKLGGYNQFGDYVEETIGKFDNTTTTRESVHAYMQPRSLKIGALDKATIAGAGTVKIGHSGAATQVIGIPAKLNDTTELLGVVGCMHNHADDENFDGRSLSIENINLTYHTFTLEDGTGFGSATVGGEATDIIMFAVLAPDSAAL